jgi:stearoyl-CoA desaturase (delta-9 desaturase)
VPVEASPRVKPLLPFSPDVAALYVGLHLSCLAAIWTGVTWGALGLCAASFFLRMFGLGVGYHRYFAHRAFKTSRAMQFLFALLGSLSVQKGPLWWAQTHRDHHRNADTPDDIHSPRYHGFLYAHSGWFMNPRHHRTELARVPDLARYPELVFLDRAYFGVIALYVWGIYLLGGWRGVVWGFCISTVLLYHVTHWIQSMSHSRGGYRRFATADASRNHFAIGLLSLGEWHNNHHHSPGSAKQGVAWWELDVGYCALWAMSRLGLVWELRAPPSETHREALPT